MLMILNLTNLALLASTGVQRSNTRPSSPWTLREAGSIFRKPSRGPQRLIMGMITRIPISTTPEGRFHHRTRTASISRLRCSTLAPLIELNRFGTKDPPWRILRWICRKPLGSWEEEGAYFLYFGANQYQDRSEGSAWKDIHLVNSPVILPVINQRFKPEKFSD